MSGLSELPNGVAVLSWQQEYTAAHNFRATILEDAATISWDLSSNQVASVTLRGNRTLANPSGGKDGGVYILFVTQDEIGSRTLTYDTNFRWANNGNTPTLSTAANRLDILTFVAFNGKLYGSGVFNFTQ
jgi:hypothetical protein